MQLSYYAIHYAADGVVIDYHLAFLTEQDLNPTLNIIRRILSRLIADEASLNFLVNNCLQGAVERCIHLRKTADKISNVIAFRLCEMMRKSNQELNQTMLIITHDENIALQCDRILTLADGRIVNDVMTGQGR